MAGVSDGWRAALVAALKRRASVEEIQAALQPLTDQDGDLYLSSEEIVLASDDVPPLASALETYTGLKQLWLQCRLLDDRTSITASRLLACNAKLTYLHVSENGISCQGATMLADAIATHPSLRKVVLAWNEIRCIGATALSRTLSLSSSLRKLSLAYNEIGDQGATALARALTSNVPLVELNIAGNVIRCQGATAISEMLTTNTTLRILAMHSNREIQLPGLQAVILAQNDNTALSSLWVDLPDDSQNSCDIRALREEERKELVRRLCRCIKIA